MAILDPKNSIYNGSDPFSTLNNSSPSGVAKQEQAKAGGAYSSKDTPPPKDGSGEATEEQNLYQKLGQTTTTSLIDATMKRSQDMGHINLKQNLDPKALQQKLGEKSEAWKEKRDSGSFAQFDENGNWMRPEDTSLYAEEDAGLMDPEEENMRPDDGAGLVDQKLLDSVSQTDAMMYGSDQAGGQANAGPSSAAMMTMDAAGGTGMGTSGGAGAPSKSAKAV